MKLDPKDFEKLWGVKLDELAVQEISKLTYEFDSMDIVDERVLINEIETELMGSQFVKAGESRESSWEKGWEENLIAYRSSKNLYDLIPKYFGKSKINRLDQNFIVAKNQDFDLNMLRAIQARVFSEYLRDFSTIYEFGCGTGHNLLYLRKFNPNATLVGLDWVTSSQEILSELKQNEVDTNLLGHKFNYFSPDFSFILNSSSAVFTIASLEQIGNRHGMFIDYLIQNKPDIVVHVEPFRDLLDPNNRVDRTSIDYMEQRSYIEGYYEAILELERRHHAKIHVFDRSFIGSKYVDGYSILVWSPLK